MRPAINVKRALFLLLLGSTISLSAGCVVGSGYGYYDYGYPSYGYYPYNDGGFVGGYYEPYEYRGWGRGYHVGPYRHDFDRDRFEHGGRGGFERGGGRMHSYSPAPASRPTPSLPSRGGFGRR